MSVMSRSRIIWRFAVVVQKRRNEYIVHDEYEEVHIYGEEARLEIS